MRPDARLHILQHALGLDDYGRTRAGERCPDETYRNRYVADDNADLAALVDAGLMQRHAPRAISGGDPIFVVTEAGRAYVRERSPRPPRVSRTRQRYLDWLHVSDATGETFGEYVKRKSKEARNAR